MIIRLAVSAIMAIWVGWYILETLFTGNWLACLIFIGLMAYGKAILFPTMKEIDRWMNPPDDGERR